MGMVAWMAYAYRYLERRRVVPHACLAMALVFVLMAN